MLFLGVLAGSVLILLLLDLWELKQRAGLLELVSQHPFELAITWLRVANGYDLVLEDTERGLLVWERGRRFDDGGVLYYCQVLRDHQTGRARFVVGVIGHAFHTPEDLACARSRFVAGQLFHLTEHSAQDALVRAGNPRTARVVLAAMRGHVGHQTTRPPAIEEPMSPTALQFTLRAPLHTVTDAVERLAETGWRLVETATINRSLVTQHRYCLEDALAHKDAGAEYLLELRGYEGDWAVFAIDWFPRPGPARPPRKPAELEAEIRSAVERVRAVPELID